MAKSAAIVLAVLAMPGQSFAAGARTDAGFAGSSARHSVHYALGCREPGDVVKEANHIPTHRCRPINLRWVKIDNYDVRIGTTEMILVEHPFYGPVYILRPQE